MALIASGPLGLAIGAGLGLVAGWTLLTQGREWSRQKLEDLSLPPSVTRSPWSGKTLKALRDKFLEDLTQNAETTLSSLAQELIHREKLRYEGEMGALSELQKLF